MDNISLEDLAEIKKDLEAQPASVMREKKLHALEVQVARIKAKAAQECGA